MPEFEKLTLNDPETQSANIVAHNVAALQALFPEAFNEGQLDFEVLQQLLGGAGNEQDEKYGLNWHGKWRARQIALTPSTGTLLPCPQDSVDRTGVRLRPLLRTRPRHSIFWTSIPRRRCQR